MTDLLQGLGNLCNSVIESIPFKPFGLWAIVGVVCWQGFKGGLWLESKIADWRALREMERRLLVERQSRKEASVFFHLSLAEDACKRGEKMRIRAELIAALLAVPDSPDGPHRRELERLVGLGLAYDGLPSRLENAIRYALAHDL